MTESIAAMEQTLHFHREQRLEQLHLGGGTPTYVRDAELAMAQRDGRLQRSFQGCYATRPATLLPLLNGD